MKTLKEIMYEYANTRGGGLPLTAEEICNSVVLWVQQYDGEDIDILSRILTIDPIIGSIKDGKLEISLEKSTLEQDFADGNFISAYELAERIKGSESIVVDVAEDEKSIEIHLDGDILAMLNRAILQPVNPVELDSVPVVSSNREVSYMPLSELGGGTKLYKHVIGFGLTRKLTCITTDPTPFTYSSLYGSSGSGSFSNTSNIIVPLKVDYRPQLQEVYIPTPGLPDGNTKIVYFDSNGAAVTEEIAMNATTFVSDTVTEL